MLDSSYHRWLMSQRRLSTSPHQGREFTCARHRMILRDSGAIEHQTRNSPSPVCLAEIKSVRRSQLQTIEGHLRRILAADKYLGEGPTIIQMLHFKQLLSSLQVPRRSIKRLLKTKRLPFPKMPSIWVCLLQMVQVNFQKLQQLLTNQSTCQRSNKEESPKSSLPIGIRRSI